MAIHNFYDLIILILNIKIIESLAPDASGASLGMGNDCGLLAAG